MYFSQAHIILRKHRQSMHSRLAHHVANGSRKVVERRGADLQMSISLFVRRSSRRRHFPCNHPRPRPAYHGDSMPVPLALTTDPVGCSVRHVGKCNTLASY